MKTAALQAPPSKHLFIRRQLWHLAFALGFLLFSLAIGMAGYSYYEEMSWRDSFVNSAMLLGGMGPIKTDLSENGKVFAGFYALYAGLAVIAVTALLLAPGVHHIMKKAHWEYRSDLDE